VPNRAGFKGAQGVGPQAPTKPLIFYFSLMKSVWPLNFDIVLDVMTWRYYMRDPYTDNNLTDYYTIIFNFVTYYI